MFTGMEEVTLRAFAANLARLMTEKDVTQSELARRTGIRQQTISDYCAGNMFPSFNRMVKIAKALHVSFFDLTMQSKSAILAELKRKK